MKLSYKNNKLEKSLTDDKVILKTYGTLSKTIKQRINQLKAADELTTIARLPALRLHPYTGARLGEWSIDIHKNWRICFTIDHDPIPRMEDGGVNPDKVTAIKILSVEDPH
jgi:toxin HigB-1